MRQKTEGAEPVTDGHDNNALRCQPLAVIQLFRRCACCEASSVNPHHDGQPFVRSCCGSPDVDVQAILGRNRQVSNRGIGLHACPSVLVSHADAVPLRCRLWGAPAEIAHRRSRVRNATIDREALFDRPLKQASIDLDGSIDGFGENSTAGKNQSGQQHHR